MVSFTRSQQVLLGAFLGLALIDLSNLNDAIVAAGSAPLVAIALVLLFRASRRTFNPWAWYLLSAGLVSLTLADIANGSRPHLVSTGWDAISITHSVLTQLGVAFVTLALLQVRRRIPKSRSASALDPWIALVALMMLATEYFIQPIIASSTLDLSHKANAMLFVAMRAWLLYELLQTWLRSGTIVSRAVNFLLLSLTISQVSEVMVLRSNVLYDFVNVPGQGTTVAAPLALVGLAFLSLAASDQTVGKKPAAVTSDSLDTSRFRVIAFVLISVAVPTLVFASNGKVRIGNWEMITYLAMSVVVFGLVTLRIVRIVEMYRGSLERERRIASITDDLLAVATYEQLYVQMNAWVRSLTGEQTARVETRALLPEEDRPHLDQREVDGAWMTEVLVPGQQPMVLEIYAAKPLRYSVVSTLTIFGRSLGLAMDRIALSESVAERATTERVESLLANASDVIALVRPDRTIEYVTPAVERLTGRSAQELSNSLWTSWVIASDIERAEILLDESRRRGSNQLEMRILTADEILRYVECNVTWVAEDDVFIITHHDVTERHHLQTQLIDQAFHDPLTGLANRALFRDRVGQALARARRSGNDFVVMLLDLDDFKTINDSLGHPAGDMLLRIAGQRLTDCLRGGDTAARLGGDEFAVVLENTWSVQDAVRVSQRILDALARPMDLGGNEVVISASLGLAVGNAASIDGDELERNADLALYQAKYGGKNRFSVYEASMHGDAVRRLQIVNDIRRAIDTEELQPWFQPIHALGTGAICGVEALVRWEHPERGLLHPVEFVQIAEETGLIVGMGLTVLRNSLFTVAGWHKRFPAHSSLRVSVNLSARQVMQDDIVDEVERALVDSRIDPSTVVLEITESVFLPGETLPTQRLRALSKLGVKVYIDDFGTGYSSLHYLRDLPVNGIKLAKEFVDGLPSKQDVGLVRAIRDLAITLGLDDIVAEGIETADQRRALRALGYHLGQGYLMSKPMPASDLEAQLSITPGEAWNQPSELVDSELVPAPAEPSALS